MDPSIITTRVVVGVSWTMSDLSLGRCGVADGCDFDGCVTVWVTGTSVIVSFDAASSSVSPSKASSSLRLLFSEASSSGCSTADEFTCTSEARRTHTRLPAASGEVMVSPYLKNRISTWASEAGPSSYLSLCGSVDCEWPGRMHIV